jgi:hypothetical protein
MSADLVVARRRAPDPYDAFFDIAPEDILLVLRQGTVVLRDASLDAAFVEVRGGESPLFSVRLGQTEKRVAENVGALLADLRACGVPANLPISVAQ